jgi:hypothetical protein
MTPNCERWCSESFLVKEVDTESQNLSVIAAAGLAALHLVEHGGHTYQSWKNQQLAVVQQAQKIKRSVITDACESIHKLVEAASGQQSCVGR